MARWGCPLCGEFHEPEFHSYPWRWSTGNDGTRRHLRVVTILCRVAHAAGRPYTRRVLPEHLIPRSPFWSGKLVALLEKESGTVSTEEACATLGCVDPRTARKHLRALAAAACAKVPVLARLLASAPSQPESPSFPPGTNPFTLLTIFWDRFLETARGTSGSSASTALRPLLWLGPGFESFRRFHRSCIHGTGPPR